MSNRLQKTAAAALIVSMLLSLLTFYPYAYDFEECYHCSKSGEFRCQKCGNTGKTVCDGCGGKGRLECPGEEDKGKCDNGHYVCPGCNGNGISKPVPGDGEAVPCGQCGGTGKTECMHCHGAGILVCDRCNGTGENECADTNCIEARKIGHKCPYCKGTGYLGDGPDFPPEYNDGVHNVPQKNDHIITDHESWTGYYFGTGETDEDRQQAVKENDDDEARDPATGRDHVWFIDVGAGVWNITGQTISVKRSGEPVSGTLDVTLNQPFEISGITDRNTHVYLIANGFKTELTELNGDHEYSVANRSPKSPKVPFNVSMSVEYIEGSAPDGPGGNDGDPGRIRRPIDFGDGVWDNGGSPVTAWIGDEKAAGVITVEAGTSIRLEGFDKESMTVYLRADDGFSVTLVPGDTGDFSIDRYEQTDSVLADVTLKFDVDMIKKEQTVEGSDDVSHDLPVIPVAAGDEPRCFFEIDFDRFSNEELEFYKSAPGEELDEITDTAKYVLASVRIGENDVDTEELFDRLVSSNGFDSFKDGRLYPITLDRRTDLPFPVKVTFIIDPGELDGGTDLYVYRRCDDGNIEPLGKADYVTYDDGSVESVSFYTKYLSSFFTAKRELDLAPSVGAPATPGDTDVKAGEKPFPTAAVVIAAVCAAAVIAAAAAVIVIKKRKSKKTS